MEVGRGEGVILTDWGGRGMMPLGLVMEGDTWEGNSKRLVGTEERAEEEEGMLARARRGGCAPLLPTVGPRGEGCAPTVGSVTD